jgi:nitrous oxide reductase accessory protein NosL
MILAGGIHAGEGGVHDAKTAKMLTMGRKAAQLFCTQKRLDAIDRTRPRAAVLAELNQSACRPMEPEYLEALYLYLTHPDATQKVRSRIDGFTHKDRCPVCGMFIYKYPKWAATMRLRSGEQIYFDGVKDLMKYYLYTEKFHYDRAEIVQMEVPDFYTLRPLDARKAWYVIGSQIRGPMGNELIAFGTRQRAETFLRDHHGIRIVRWDAITPSLIAQVDRYVRH